MAGLSETIIFDRSNTPLAVIEPMVNEITWRFNSYGRARFFLEYSDDECTPSNLQFGNKILFRFDNGLPDWGGVIDTPRRQNDDGVVVTAYTGEKFFDWRVTGKSVYFDGVAPGTIYSTLILQASALEELGLAAVNVYIGETPRTTEYHYHELLRRFVDLQRLTGHDFDVTVSYDGGEIGFDANWYETKGIDRREGVWLIEDRNVTTVTMDEQGIIANRVITVGDGQTWGDERLEGVATDTISQGLYGLREWATVQSGVKNQSTLDANAEQLLEDMKDPRKKFNLRALDQDPAAFDAYDVGDRVTLSCFLNYSDWSYEGVVRVIGRTWYPTNECRLEVEEWTS